MLNSSFTSQSSQLTGDQVYLKPEDLNKISIRLKQGSFQIQIPYLQQSDRNVYIESFAIFDTAPLNNSTDHAQQFFLYCDNSTGFYRFNGKQTLLCAFSNWDGDANKQIYSMVNQVPFKVKRGDNTLNFVITRAAHNETLYPQETEGTVIDNSQTRFLFNIVLNIREDI